MSNNDVVAMFLKKNGLEYADKGTNSAKLTTIKYNKISAQSISTVRYYYLSDYCLTYHHQFFDSEFLTFEINKSDCNDEKKTMNSED